MPQIIRLVLGYTLNRHKLIEFMRFYNFLDEKVNNILLLGYEDIGTIMKLKINLPHKIKLYTNTGTFESNYLFENNVLGIELASFPMGNEYASFMEIENFKLLSQVQSSLNRLCECFPKVNDMIFENSKIHVIYNFR